MSDAKEALIRQMAAIQSSEFEPGQAAVLSEWLEVAWKLVRDEPLSADEAARLEDLVREARRVLGEGA